MELRGVIRNMSYTEQACEVIKHLIFSGAYEPGQQLKEVDLSKILGVSRSPIREAIHSLANEGLVRIVPQRGAFVSTFDIGEIRELYEVREALETLAARLAAERAEPAEIVKLSELLEATREVLDRSDSVLYPRDLDFHHYICGLGRNRKLVAETSEIHAQLQLARLKSGSKPGRAERAYTEHMAIYEAIKERNPQKAERAMRYHLHNGLRSTIEVFSSRSTGAA